MSDLDIRIDCASCRHQSGGSPREHNYSCSKSLMNNGMVYVRPFTSEKKIFACDKWMPLKSDIKVHINRAKYAIENDQPDTH